MECGGGLFDKYRTAIHPTGWAIRTLTDCIRNQSALPLARLCRKNTFDQTHSSAPWTRTAPDRTAPGRTGPTRTNPDRRHMIKPPARRSPRESHARPGPAATLTGSDTAGRPDARTHGRPPRTDRHGRTDPDAPAPSPPTLPGSYAPPRSRTTTDPQPTGPRRRSTGRIFHPGPQGKSRTRPGLPPSPPPPSKQVRTRTYGPKQGNTQLKLSTAHRISYPQKRPKLSTWPWKPQKGLY